MGGTQAVSDLNEICSSHGRGDSKKRGACPEGNEQSTKQRSDVENKICHGMFKCELRKIMTELG